MQSIASGGLPDLYAAQIGKIVQQAQGLADGKYGSTLAAAVIELYGSVETLVSWTPATLATSAEPDTMENFHPISMPPFHAVPSPRAPEIPELVACAGSFGPWQDGSPVGCPVCLKTVNDVKNSLVPGMSWEWPGSKHGRVTGEVPAHIA